MLPARIDPAFVTTHFGFQQGVALLEVPKYAAPDLERHVDLRLLGLVERFDVGVRFQELIGVFATLEGLAVTGFNPETALLLGARGGYRWDAGVASTVFRDRELGLAVGVRLRGNCADRHQVTPARLIDALHDEPDRTLDDILEGQLFRYLLVRQRFVTAGASIACAMDFGSGFSLQGALNPRCKVPPEC